MYSFDLQFLHKCCIIAAIKRGVLMENYEIEYKGTIPNIILPKSQFEDECKFLGRGTEGLVKLLDGKFALKRFVYPQDRVEDGTKMKKVKELATLSDPSIVFPLGTFSFKDGENQGCFADYIETHPEYFHFSRIDTLRNIKKYLSLAIELSDAVKRGHDMGLIFGDIKNENVIVDVNETPRIIDIDSVAYHEFDYDCESEFSQVLDTTYDQPFSEVDNDKYALAIMTMKFFLRGYIEEDEVFTDSYLAKELLKLVRTNKEAKEVLTLIFSDSHDKPYIKEALKRFDPEEELFRKEDLESFAKRM